MGTDITAFVEHPEPSNRGGFYWDCFAEVQLERDYRVFAAIAGVRGAPPAPFPPRGFPDDASAIAEFRYYLPVVRPGEEAGAAGMEYVTAADAAEVVRKGGRYQDSRQQCVSTEDAHSVSWLTRQEILHALSAADIDLESIGPAWKATLDVMAYFEKPDHPPVRLVFWFSD